jgi:predicted exporter
MMAGQPDNAASTALQAKAISAMLQWALHPDGWVDITAVLFHLQAKAPKRPRRTAKDPEAAAAADAAKRQVAGQVARDQHLSVYHAVGKLLHYKRQQPGESDSLQQQQHAGAAAGSSKKAKQQEEGGGDDSDVEIIDAAASQQELQTNSRCVES